MSALQVALYARVSSEHQAMAATIASQVAALRERIAADGLMLAAALTFVDDGFSGATLVRPALERLRDVAAMGGIDRLYVLAPDRLARRYAYQVLLIEELQRAGVDLVFLAHARGTSCSCKYRAWSPNTSAPRSWSAAAVAGARERSPERWRSSATRPTATATYPRRSVAGRRSMRWCPRRPRWCARSLPGSGGSA